MTFAITRSEKEFTARDWTKTKEARPRRADRLAGGYIADKVALRNAISLCLDCARKFAALKYGYVTKKNIPFVRGICDGCQEYCDPLRLFLHHEQLPS